MTVHLHINVDHVATLRQARGVSYPDPVAAAVLCEQAGADGITVHLREDRRHIQERDVRILRETVQTVLNLEMAPTPEMAALAESLKPDIVTLVPERREERTTEGGLDVKTHAAAVEAVYKRLAPRNIAVSLFIDPDPEQVRASIGLGAWGVEFHTGDYANAPAHLREEELAKIGRASSFAKKASPGLRIAAGHGLTTRNVPELVAAVSELVELNIGHAVVADAVFLGIERAVRGFREAIGEGERRRQLTRGVPPQVTA